MLAPPSPQPVQPANTPSSSESRTGMIEIVLPNGARVSVDAFVNEKALSRRASSDEGYVA